jgi:3'(2'), 5'-bisphosphate nucleotidase
LPNSLDLTKLLTPAIDIARDAGRAILVIYDAMLSSDEGRRAALVARKADDSPLTQADLAAHRLITQRLRELRPELPVVSEEDDAGDAGRMPARGAYWLVDPLDGTKEFLEGSGEFTVNIALIQDGAARMGVVHAPALGQSYWGGAGLGAFRETGGRVEAIRVAAPAPEGTKLRVVASKSHMNAPTAKFIEALGPHELVQAGSSLKFCRVAEGAADIYPRLGPTSEWDTAAAQAVLEAAGGHVWTLDGARLRYGKATILNPEFVASAMPPSALPGRS